VNKVSAINGIEQLGDNHIGTVPAREQTADHVTLDRSAMGSRCRNEQKHGAGHFWGRRVVVKATGNELGVALYRYRPDRTMLCA
jgi:hypothetical protein